MSSGWRPGRGLASWLAAAALLAPAGASAFPLLRLYLDGDVQSLGEGGGEAFRNTYDDALLLQRPAILANEQSPRVLLSFENQEILSVKADRWDGTRADDRALRLTAIAPAGEVLPGVRPTLLAGARRETGYTHIQNEKTGPLLHFEESRDIATVGAATTLPFGLSLGATLESAAAGVPGYVVEGRYQPARAVGFWYLRREAAYSYRLGVPDGVASNFASPELIYEIDHQRQENEIGAELGLPELAWIRGGVLVDAPNDAWAEVGGRPLSWLALRAGMDRRVFRFDDFMRAEGTGTIATVDLGLKRQRWFGGADVDLPARQGRLAARYIHADIQSASHADELGTAAARAFLDVDLDLGLLFRSGYQLESHQLSVGWSPRGARVRDGKPTAREGFDYSLGLQALRLVSQPADYALTSNTLSLSLAAEEFRPATVDMIGATGSVQWVLGRFTVSGAVGQYVPVAVHSEKVGPEAPDPGGGGGGAPAGEPKGPAQRPYFDLAHRVFDAFERYGGGNLLMLQLAAEF